MSTGVDRFIVYGGFAVALGERYRRELVSEAAKAVWGPAGRWDDMIELGHPDDESGMLGAGRYATEFAS